MGMKLTISGSTIFDLGYWYFLAEAAMGLGIERFISQNQREEDIIVAFAQGEEDALKAFMEHAKTHFPRDASVERVIAEDYSGYVPKIESFLLLFNVQQSQKFISNANKVLDKQDSSLEKQDSMLDKQDETINAIKSVKDDTSTMLDKQDETITVIREEGEKMRDEITSTIKGEGKKTRGALKDHLSRDIARLYDEIDEIKSTLARVVEKVGA